MADKNTLFELDNLLAELNSDITPKAPPPQKIQQPTEQRKSQKLGMFESPKKTAFVFLPRFVNVVAS